MTGPASRRLTAEERQAIRDDAAIDRALEKMRGEEGESLGGYLQRTMDEAAARAFEAAPHGTLRGYNAGGCRDSNPATPACPATPTCSQVMAQYKKNGTLPNNGLSPEAKIIATAPSRVAPERPELPAPPEGKRRVRLRSNGKITGLIDEGAVMAHGNAFVKVSWEDEQGTTSCRRGILELLP
jgi:hypothetical protein